VPFVLILSTILLMIMVYGVFTLVDNHSINHNFEPYFGTKKVKISLLAGLTHFIWWSIFFFVQKKHNQENTKFNNSITNKRKQDITQKK